MKVDDLSNVRSNWEVQNVDGVSLISDPFLIDEMPIWQIWTVFVWSE